MAAAHATKQNTRDGERIVARNRRAHFDYELTDKFEAGLVLIGSEARSLRIAAADLSDAWVDITSQDEAWVKGMRIPELKHAAFAHSEKRPRKLLLHLEEIRNLRTHIEADGMTIVVTSCYFHHGHAKLEIALGRGRKKHDKRNLLREREADREARDAMKRAR